MFRRILLIASLFSLFAVGFLPAQEDDVIAEKDSSAGLPKPYANTHFIASNTVSPDQKMAVIYPKEDDEKSKDILVSLKPFKILAELDTKWPYFAHQSNSGISAQWAPDNSVVLVTLESKWGPGDMFLYEMRDGKVTRTTNLLSKINELLKPDYDKAKPEPYNDQIDFILDDDMVEQGRGDSDRPAPQCTLNGSSTVQVKAGATTDPKHIGGIKAWDAKFDGTWDIAQAKFTSAKVKRIFAGKRKDD